MSGLYPISRRTGLALLAAWSIPARAAETVDWPTGPVRLVVPFSPGGTADILARQLAPRLSELLDRTVVIDNRTGAGGNIGMEAVAHAQPDGRTWLLTSSVLAANPAFFKMPVDPRTALVPVLQLARSELVLFARADLPVRTPADLMALARDNREGLTCGASGGGTRLGCELLRQQPGAHIVVVPYKGSAPAMSALAAGQIDLSVDLQQAGQALLRAGRIRLIASTGDAANDREALPGFDITAWQAVFGPAGTPAALTARFNAALNQVLAEPATMALLQSLGLARVGGSAQTLARVLERDTERYGRIARTAGIEPE